MIKNKILVVVVFSLIFASISISIYLVQAFGGGGGGGSSCGRIEENCCSGNNCNGDLICVSGTCKARPLCKIKIGCFDINNKQQAQGTIQRNDFKEYIPENKCIGPCPPITKTGCQNCGNGCVCDNEEFTAGQCSISSGSNGEEESGEESE